MDVHFDLSYYHAAWLMGAPPSLTWMDPDVLYLHQLLFAVLLVEEEGEDELEVEEAVGGW